MESNFIDWHPADIIAGLRKKGTSMAASLSQKWFEFLNAGERIYAPWPKRRDDYCESHEELTGYLAITLPRSADP